MDAPSPGPMTRSSSRSSLRKQTSKPYARRSSLSRQSSVEEAQASQGGSGLTKYVGEVNLGFDEAAPQKRSSRSSSGGAEEEADVVPDLAPAGRTRTIAGGRGFLGKAGKKKAKGAGDAVDEEMEEEDDSEITGRSVSTFGRALSSFRQGKPAGPKEIDLWKEDKDAILGITFEVPADESLKGVVVAQIHAGYLMARSKKLRVGDVIHAVNGMPVTTPQQGASLLREAKGIIQLVVSRVHAKPKESEEAGKEDGLGKDAARTRSFLPVSLPGRKKPKGGKEDAAEPEAAANTTVVVSCSQLILESKKIVGEAAGLDEQLDALYSSLKAKEIGSQAALSRLMELVGQTTVEQAGLVIANAHQGTLPDGWVEYFDKETNRCYYYNVHTKTTTWYKPRKDKPPPPPPPGAPPSATTRRRSSGGSSVGGSSDGGRAPEQTGTNTGHGVADAIAAMQTKKKMVETVQIECAITPRNGPQGLQSVSL